MSFVADASRVCRLPAGARVAGAFAWALAMMALFLLATLGLLALGGGPGR